MKILDGCFKLVCFLTGAFSIAIGGYLCYLNIKSYDQFVFCGAFLTVATMIWCYNTEEK